MEYIIQALYWVLMLVFGVSGFAALVFAFALTIEYGNPLYLLLVLVAVVCLAGWIKMLELIFDF